ncbi:DNA polymerase delta catalytic subunit [Galdieria sulphuraria]|nr:DNA polymerase delta catalytic subunit [Galdieria sulphuraria]
MDVTKLFLATRLWKKRLIFRKETSMTFKRNTYLKVDPHPPPILSFFDKVVSLQSIQGKVVYHEVLTDKRKLFFDLDGPSGSFGEEEVEQLIQACLCRLPGIDNERGNVVVLWSSKLEEKASCHVVFSTTLLPDGDISHDLASYLSDLKIFPYVDKGVYHPNHSLRCPLSSKMKTERFFRCPMDGDILCRSLVSCIYHSTHLVKLKTISKTKKEIPLDVVHADVLVWCSYINRKLGADLRFRKIENGRFLLFDRTEACLYCPICSRFHSRENPYFDLKTLKFFCRRGPREKGIRLSISE